MMTDILKARFDGTGLSTTGSFEMIEFMEGIPSLGALRPQQKGLRVTRFFDLIVLYLKRLLHDVILIEHLIPLKRPAPLGWGIEPRRWCRKNRSRGPKHPRL